MIKKITACCFALLLHTSALQAETLAEVFDFALANDPTYQGAYSSYLANKEVYPQAIGQMLPSLSGSASSTGTHSGFNTLGGYNLQSRQLTLRQPVLHIDHWAQISKTRNQVKQITATYSAAAQDLIIRVAQKYFDVLAAEDDLVFSRSQRTSFARHLEQTQQRFDVGLIAITDVHDAKSRHDNAVAKEIAAKNALSDQQERLREITGQWHETFSPLPAGSSIPLLTPAPNDIEQWVATAIKQNWELQAALYAKKSAKSEIWRVRSGHFPTLDIDASLKRGNSTPPLNFTADTQTLGLTVSLPIFQGGTVLSKTREAKHLQQKARHDYDKTLKSIVSQARRSYRGVLTEISSVESLTQAVASNQSALDASQAAYEVGTRTIVDVLDAQASLLSAEKDNAKAYYSYMIELLKLKQAAGTLAPVDLYEISDWLTGTAVASSPKA